MENLRGHDRKHSRGIAFRFFLLYQKYQLCFLPLFTFEGIRKVVICTINLAARRLGLQ